MFVIPSLLLSMPFLLFFYIQAGTRTIDIELTTLSSTNHVELTPSDAGFQDRYIVQEIIKEMAKNRPIDSKGKRGHKGGVSSPSPPTTFISSCLRPYW